MSRERRLLVVALLISSIALLFGACSDGNDDATPETEAVDPAELLERSAARIEEAQSFRFTLEHENGATVILDLLEMERAEGEVAGPNEMSLQAEARAGPLAVEVGIIVLPEESWVTNPLTGRWERQQLDVSAFFDPANGVPALMRGIQDASISGTENIDGIETYVVDATVDSGDLALFAQGAAAGTALPARAWIGVDDPLVYRVEIRGAITASEPENLVRRLQLRDWGAEIMISPPR